MSEWKLFDGDHPHVSTAEFHANRSRAAHLEEDMHRPRLLKSAGYVAEAVALGYTAVSDLGCGDGGLLSLLPNDVDAWGYDFCPANTEGWAERGITATFLDVFGNDSDKVQFGQVTCVTEVLEHLADPHDAVEWIAQHSNAIVASSPWGERPGAHDECHAWAFDMDGYRHLIERAGFRVEKHEQVGPFQLVLGLHP